VDPRRWWWLAGALPVVIACTVAASNPALRPLGDLAVAVAGLVATTVLWVVGGHRAGARFAWRLLSLAPLFPVLGAVLGAAVEPSDPVELVVLRWVPTVPGYLIGIVAILMLAGRTRLRSAGVRLAVELALFSSACHIVVQVLLLGPGTQWSALGGGKQLILGAAVVASSATMAASLTVLGVIEARRQRMALVLLAGTVLLAAGRGLSTSALLPGAVGAVDVSRFLLVAGLGMLCVAVLVDPVDPVAERPESPATGRYTSLGQSLPHLAMVVAATLLGGVLMAGHRPSAASVAGAVCGVVLSAVHRRVCAGHERRLATRLRRSEAYFRSLVRSSGDAVVILDRELCTTWASSALERVLGPAAIDLLGRPLLDAVHPEDAPTVAAALPSALPTEDGVAARHGSGLLLLRLRDAEGVWRYLEAGVNDLRADPDVGAVVLHCRDMTERHAREQALLGVAYTDPMTGLPNRAGFLHALQQEMDQNPGAGDGDAVIMMIELGDLVEAREQVGRDAVTRVLAEIGRRLRATVRGEDVVARLGVGGFAVLSHGEPGEADRLASRLLSVVEQPVVTAEGVVDLTAGIGLVPVGDATVEELFHRADLAVRAAHEAGPGYARRYEPALSHAAERRDRLRTALQGACAQDQLFLMYQPIVALDQQRITGIEAQLRWRHPELGEIQPAEFLPLAERAGMVGELMRWALRESTSAAVGLTAGERSLKVGLKVPTGYAATGTLVPDVEHALRASRLAPERLVLQISSPTVAADDERAGLDVTTLRLMGVHVALEGFGSGESALAHLTRLPLDIVKLDRSLITRIDRDPQSRALCESVIGIGHALGLDVVAEGVETPAQLATLISFGCTFAQGFHIARPVSAAGLAALLDSGAEVWPGLVGSR
jgi:diguanylate cyclase (GGDEF)-like protein/PAS domain S-box-containing protein